MCSKTNMYIFSFTKYNDFLLISPFNYLIMTHRERNNITEQTWIISNSFWMLDSRKIGHWKNETNRFKASTKHSMIILSTNTPKNLTNIWKWYSYLNSLLQGNQECAKNWKNTSPFCLKPNFLTFHFFCKLLTL